MTVEVLKLAHANPQTEVEASTLAKVTKLLSIAGVELSLIYGWPSVLDGMLSAYYSLALVRLGPARLAEVLTDLADQTLKRRVQ